jgi:5,5'-dehydrodivanillate O-demethylase
MLSHEENLRLSETSAGTPMGELLRRYWYPIAAISDFAQQSTKQVRLLSEDLVLYKDRSGTYGLLALHCPHRRADLSYGLVEECGLRCSYHGWAFDEAGNRVMQPFEDTSSDNSAFRDRVHQPAYPVEEMAGLLFAYLGPSPAPVLPRWETYDYKNGFAQIVTAPIDCNWLQAAENDLDAVHFEWLHHNWSVIQMGRTGPYALKSLKIEVEETAYGFGYRRFLENGQDGQSGRSFPRLHLMPAVFVPIGTHLEYRVPVDDTHTLSLVWAWEAVPLEEQPYVQSDVPHWQATITDPVTGRWITSHVMNQDTVAWIGQGVLADRENEHLGRADVGIVMFRNRLIEDMAKVGMGQDPSGVFRDPDARRLVRWPDNRRAVLEPGIPQEQRTKDKANFADSSALRDPDDFFSLYAGQPEGVRAQYKKAMGL